MQSSLFYKFMYAPQFRILRLLMLCLVILLFSLSEMITHYFSKGVSATTLIILILNGFLCKVMPIYIMIRFNLIRILQRRKFAAFGLIVIAFVIIFSEVQWAMEAFICRNNGIDFYRHYGGSWKSFLLDTAANYVIWMFVILGIIMIYLLKYWETENLHKRQMEKSNLEMKTKLMKMQVSPALLCSTLHKGGTLAESEPAKVSDNLMTLSRMLRYQLYDCRCETTLLDSELKFLRNYLSLLKFNGECADFSLSVSGSTIGIMIPSLLFAPFLQTPEKIATTFIQMKFNISQNTLNFDLADGCENRNCDDIRRRLEHAYPQRYTLRVEPCHVSLSIQI